MTLAGEQCRVVLFHGSNTHSAAHLIKCYHLNTKKVRFILLSFHTVRVKGIVLLSLIFWSLFAFGPIHKEAKNFSKFMWSMNFETILHAHWVVSSQCRPGWLVSNVSKRGWWTSLSEEAILSSGYVVTDSGATIPKHGTTTLKKAAEAVSLSFVAFSDPIL